MSPRAEGPLPRGDEQRRQPPHWRAFRQDRQSRRVTSEHPSGNAPRLLHEFFERQVARQPARPAVQCDGEVLTYLQLDQVADSIAISLRCRGIGPGSLVALYLGKSCRLFAALLGVLKAGAG